MQKKLHPVPEHPVPEHPVPEHPVPKPLLQKKISSPVITEEPCMCQLHYVSRICGPYGGCTGQPQWKCVLTMRSILSASCSAARASRSS